MGNMDRVMLTRDEYIAFANRHGCFDEINIELSYKYYVASFSDDPNDLVKADNGFTWNNYYRVEGRFN
jgi:hypothetical protein